MEQKKDSERDPEVFDPEDEKAESDNCDKEKDHGFDEDFDEELDEKTLRFVRRVLFPSVIALVIAIVAVAAVFMQRSGREGQESLPMEEEAAEAPESPDEEQVELAAEEGEKELESSEQKSADVSTDKGTEESGESKQSEQRPADVSAEEGAKDSGKSGESEQKPADASADEKDTEPEPPKQEQTDMPSESGTEESGTEAETGTTMPFAEVNEEVTAKDATNLRDMPSQGEGSTVVYTLANGEKLIRTGISDSGWSRLTYNGQTVYAVSSYLTTDLAYQTPKQEGEGSGDGLKTKFADRNEQVTAKIEVNLRVLPSVTNPDAAVAAVLHNGEYATRTGINEDYGWSRVEYNGQTLYCISSYLCE